MSHNLVIMHYENSTVEFVNVPDEYKDNIEEYIFDIMDLNESEISWMYDINGINVIEHEA